MKNKGEQFKPSEYDKQAGFVQLQDAKYLLSKTEVNDNATVLDVGCGDGQFTEYLATKIVSNGIVVGLDKSEDMIKHAKKKHDVSNLVFLHGDVQNASKVLQGTIESLGKFDVIFSSHTLHWLFEKDSHKTALYELNECLHSESGRMLLCFAIDGTFKELFQAGYEIIDKIEWSKYYHVDDLKPRQFPSPKFYDSVLTELNYRSNLEVTEHWREFPNRNALANWFIASIQTFMAPLKDLSDDVKQSFASDVLDRYIEIVLTIDDYPGDLSEEKLFLRCPMAFIRASRLPNPKLESTGDYKNDCVYPRYRT